MKGSRSKKILRIVLPIVVVILVFPLVAGCIWFYDLTRSPLPQHDGELKVAGLRDTVEILRDEWGVPHIYAKNRYDLFFAQGYTQAQDRWWQMEFWRHTASGRIEELVGKNTGLLKADIFLRSVGWKHVAEQEVKSYDSESLSVLQAFADGVNAYIMNRKPKELALEYSVLGLRGIDAKIEPWTPADSLAFAKIMAWDLGFRRSADATRAKLYLLMGPEMTEQWLTPPWPFGKKPTILKLEELGIIKSDVTTNVDYLTELSGVEMLYTENIWPDKSKSLVMGHAPGDGSNNWETSGRMTKSGKPLLANDPHLSIQMPSIWYQIGLHCQSSAGEAPLDVVGFAFAATPGVIIGHNSSIAWGLTNVFPDVHDLYVIRVNPDNPLQYEWNGEWRNVKVYDETIYFGDGAEPVTIKVRETHLGPIINDNQVDAETGEVLGFENKMPVALRWTALEPGTILKAVVGINKATNWEEFREALRYWDVPSQNVIYADVKGNIGYQLPGRIPIRAKNHSGLMPAPGWTDAFEWKGFIPYDSLPRAFNPERGYIATANQAVVPQEYYEHLEKKLGEGLNYVFGLEWNYGYRAQRIEELLEKMAPHTVSSFQAILGDNKLLSAEELTPYLANLKFDDAELAQARDWLLKWDYQCNADSPQAALYAQFWASLVRNLYYDQLGDVAQPDGDNREMWATLLLMEKPDNAWWDDITTKDVVESRDDILIRSFKEGYANTVATLGKDRDNWKWGDLHTSTFVSSPLGQSGIGLIEKMVNRGPFPTGGSSDTVNNTRWTVASGDFAVGWLPSMRMIVDLGDFTKSVTIHTTGQSGHPYSKYYDNLIERWLNMEYYPMLWTREQVEKAAIDRLILNPGK